MHRVRKKKPKGSSKRGQQSAEQDDQPQQQTQPGIEDDVDYHPDPVETAVAANVYQETNFVQQPVITPDTAGPSRQPAPYPPPYGT